MRSSVDADVHAQLVAAQRVVLERLEVVRLELAEVPRALVVVEDVVAVEVVHRQPSRAVLRIPRRSVGRRTAEDRARRAARRRARRCRPARCRRPRSRARSRATPRQRISGCAQWWPARMHTPAAVGQLGDVVRVHPLDRERREAAARARPRGGRRRAGRAPLRRRSSMYAVSARSCARTRSMPERRQVVDGRAQADGLGDQRRARLELPRQLVPGRAARSRPRRSCRRRSGTAPSARASRGGRAARRCRSGRAPCGRSRRRSRRRARPTSTGICGTACGAVDERHRAGGARARDDLRDRVDRAEHVRDVRERDHPHVAARELGVELRRATARRARRPPGSAAPRRARGRAPARARCSRGAPSA